MGLIKFFREVNKLKKVKRTGWIIDEVKNPESVADHSFMVSLMTLVLGSGRKNLDLDKAVKMAIVHDMMESICGDVVAHKKYRPFEGTVSTEEKKELEKKAIKELISMLGEKGREYLELWEEVEKGETEEARFVEQVDKLELALQALEYEKEGNFSNKYNDLNHYFVFVKENVKDPELVKILDEIISSRMKK